MRDILTLNTVSHTMRADLGPYIDDMNVLHAYTETREMVKMWITTAVMPKLGKTRINALTTLVSTYSITVRRLLGTSDDRASIYKVHHVDTSYADSYIYVADRRAQYVMGCTQQVTLHDMNIYSIPEPMELLDMISLYRTRHVLRCMDDTDRTDILHMDLNLRKLIMQKYSSHCKHYNDYVDDLIKSIPFLLYITGPKDAL
jgi:hypothetical protein